MNLPCVYTRAGCQDRRKGIAVTQYKTKYVSFTVIYISAFFREKFTVWAVAPGLYSRSVSQSRYPRLTLISSIQSFLSSFSFARPYSLYHLSQKDQSSKAVGVKTYFVSNKLFRPSHDGLYASIPHEYLIEPASSSLFSLFLSFISFISNRKPKLWHLLDDNISPTLSTATFLIKPRILISDTLLWLSLRRQCANHPSLRLS